MEYFSLKHLIGICLLVALSKDGLVSCMSSNEAKPSCKPSDEICYFSWTVTRKQTMLLYEGTHDGGLAMPIVSRDGKFYKRPKCGSDDTLVPATQEELDKVSMADGSYKYVYAVNGEFPGPSIVVYEGQEVVINVTNKLYQEALSIHWHGVIQRKTNWMDGVAGLTQCGIQPQETFMYRFMAYPVGTHFYHSHQGLQRSDGLFGPFIVLEHPDKEGSHELKETDPPEPTYAKDYIIDLVDFFPLESNLAMVSFMANQKQFLFHGYNKTGYCYGGAGKQLDGKSAGTYRFISALINGKGYHYDANGNPLVDVPLETYAVTKGQYYRFRVINSAMTYSFMVSVDQHPIVVIASDGGHIMPVKADKVVVNPGERFDFYILADKAVDNYWIRAETIEATHHQTVAVLRYDTTSTSLPTSTESCANKKCVVVNCPFASLPGTRFDRCINFESLKSREIHKDDDDDDDEDEKDKFDEYFISFEKTRTPGKKKRNAANGIQFVPPSSPPTVLGYSKYDHDCDKMDCNDQPCQCTHQMKVKLKRTIQITMLANTTHPMHLHGNLFKVVKVGYPEYDPVTHLATKMNADLKCNNDLCNKASWSDKSWYGGNIPGINTVDPAIKDTVTIPGNGYVVIQFKAKNPGWWLFHCHIETHFFQGMGLIVQIGEESEMIPPPAGFNKCGTYTLSHEEFRSAMKKRKWYDFAKISHSTSNEMTNREKGLLIGIIGAAVGGIVVGAIIVLVIVKVRGKQTAGTKGDTAKYSPREEEVALNK